ncbi:MULTISPECIES: DNA alkylation repair protein [unclassified Janthinobacterium]|uniref:DNA alkylation repair protein n=1 Tax=unclassified Janthinobacterium TaxID=2610881 RepID=UPI0016135DD0|nr:MULTISPECIES: DNA alkylation repair protein [unclassified Janthinobacterium]MBB5368245.1 3-methyladenine DNA glycosylase AlkC [Janthinobacterium sp. K2C7]MBB5382218.1 3-methyladenine DNA glycosylase AlkC [Janthinobacterium sp. K2Li3]MBB5386627.1 3-methyladenine DNA glycosylase AlkC [Janthinobacterium sp. K2E3]
MTTSTNTPLKQSMGAQQLRTLSATLAAIAPAFDETAFLATALDGLEQLSLMQRVRRASEAIAAASLAMDGYEAVLPMLMEAAPRLGNGFVSLVAPDYVSQHGRHAFERSMDALKFFTRYGTSEFAVRDFLRDEPQRALDIMQGWSRDTDAAVRRLASEGSRPRLPWSFRLRMIEQSPELAAPILDNLRADTSLYVRKSVANHLNDVTKTHPAWVLERAALWGVEDANTRWIVRHALRTLLKQGNQQALSMLGAETATAIVVGKFEVTPGQINLGDSVILACQLSSTAAEPQKLLIHHRISYVRQNQSTTAKVFKLKEVTLEPGQHIAFERRQQIRDFTTRTHYAGHHQVELIVNGQLVAQSFFDLVR